MKLHAIVGCGQKKDTFAPHASRLILLKVCEMPVYNIAGVEIDFPYDAYREQLVYMEKVILALETGENALLESPTGTGKTLCLLCATLGWQRAAKNKRHEASIRYANDSYPTHGDGWVKGLQSAVSNGQSSCTPLQADMSSTARTPRIIYSSRTHTQLQQVIRELRKTTYRPKTCVLGSREQLCVHHEVSKLGGNAQSAACHALTANQQCSFHRKFQDERRRAGGQLPHPDERVDEASREVPDIEDFVSVHKVRRAAPSRRSVAIGRSGSLCSRRGPCSIGSSLSLLPPLKRGRLTLHASLSRLGSSAPRQAREVCPFFLARESQRTSEILFLPYNYLIDVRTRQRLNIHLTHDVLIFDEVRPIHVRIDLCRLAPCQAHRRVCSTRQAHNIESVCSDAASFNLSSIEIASAVRELDRVIAGSQNKGEETADGEASGEPSTGVWLRLREIILEVDKAMHAVPLSEPQGGGNKRHVTGGEGFQQMLSDVCRASSSPPILRPSRRELLLLLFDRHPKRVHMPTVAWRRWVSQPRMSTR